MTREEAIRCLNVHSSTNGSGLCTDKQHYKAKQLAIKALEQEPKLIPVSERLPEINEWVLCQCRANIYEVLKFTSYGWYHDDAHCYMDGFVIAWMPLPQPYKAERSE